CKAHSRILPTEDYESSGAEGERLETVAKLQQKAAALEFEVGERRKLEETLRHRELELRNFVETAPVGMHWVDANGIIIWANAAELALLGYSSGEYLGHHIAEFHSDQAVIDDILRRLQQRETIRDREVRMRCKGGALKT